jgi:hypothetical protein
MPNFEGKCYENCTGSSISLQNETINIESSLKVKYNFFDLKDAKILTSCSVFVSLCLFKSCINFMSNLKGKCDENCSYLPAFDRMTLELVSH